MNTGGERNTFGYGVKGAAMASQPDNSHVNDVKSKPFGKMTRKEKATHIAKLFLCILTFGFLFPNIGAD